MAYQIEYAYTCHIGKIRNNNEDNFWCCGDSLEAQNQGMSHIRSGYMKQSEYPLLAVFDGMGGESCGEMAAFLAAEACGEHFKTAKDGIRNDPEEFLNEICESMNQAICDYGRTNKINSMGTTAALLAFAEDADFTRPRPGAQFVWKGTINTVSWDGRRKSAAGTVDQQAGN